jgi:RNA polymerase sigma factor for flagellar operon FliA
MDLLRDQSMDRHRLFLEHLPQIEAVIACVCRRNHCDAEEAEEFAAEVRAKLIEDACQVLGRFKGKSSFETYLTTVVQRLYLDRRNQRWGKWRPSAEARRLGPVALWLEELARDGYGFDESCEILRTKHQVTVSVPELAQLAARLPLRQPRRVEGEERLRTLPCEAPSPEERALAREQRYERQRLYEAVMRALAPFSAEDRLLIKQRFASDVPMKTVAAGLGVEPKRLYRRLERLQKRLRRALEREGIRGEDVTDLLRGSPEPEDDGD